MMNRKALSAMFMICFLFVGVSFAAEVIKQDSFDNTIITPFDPYASETIKEDIIMNTNTMDKSYRSYLMSNSEAKLMAKNLKLYTEPKILERCPLNERTGVLYTGKANMFCTGISRWYSFAGVMYDFDSLCDTLAVSFSYLNTRLVATGKVVLVVQQVDTNDNILWEKTIGVAGWSTIYKGWRDLYFTKERLATYLAGHKFNRVWLVEAELFLDKTGGGYFDDIILTVTNSDPEPDPETPPTLEDAIGDISKLCPCNNNWKNHGQYVSCVAQAKNSLKNEYSDEILSKAVSEAAQSDCGKK